MEAHEKKEFRAIIDSYYETNDNYTFKWNLINNDDQNSCDFDISKKNMNNYYLRFKEYELNAGC